MIQCISREALVIQCISREASTEAFTTTKHSKKNWPVKYTLFRQRSRLLSVLKVASMLLFPLCVFVFLFFLFFWGGGGGLFHVL